MKVGAKPLSAEIGESLRSIQLGLSTRGGCEAAARADCKYLSGVIQRKIPFKVDKANAFNSIRRDVFLVEARRRSPGLYRMLWQAYTGSYALFYVGTNLLSTTGIEQADPFFASLRFNV